MFSGIMSSSQDVGPLVLSASSLALGKQFSDKEIQIFTRDLATLAEMPALQRDLGDILLKYSEVLLTLCGGG